MDDLNAVYKGIVTEHICAQEIISESAQEPARLFFWVREKKQSNAEVDFLAQHEEYAIPVEVKSGKGGALRSLHQFVNSAHHPFAVRFYSGSLRIDELETPEGKRYKLLNLPYYLSGRIKEYLRWFIER